MKVSVIDRFSVTNAAELYGLDHWSHGYLAIGADGHLRVTPDGNGESAIDVYEVVRDLVERGYKTPLLLRFPRVLGSQVRNLGESFRRAIAEYGYRGQYHPVFPIKVNQRRRVVEELLSSGREYGLGLEVGSRPELMAAAALPMSPDAVIVCNGFKDREYLSSAALATRLGKRVIVVIEKPFELDPVIELAEQGGPLPLIGFRLRLQARGSGLWEKSGGFASKFGLTTRQLLDGIERLTAAGLADRIALLHFHIGSQVTEIRKIKTAVREAGRVYAKLKSEGVDIRYVDVGGGLGIDYDGSRTSSDASVNYTVQEYANDVVFGLHEVCEQEEVEPPTILSESGRWLVGYHSVLITDVRGVIPGCDDRPLQIGGAESQVVQDLAEVARTMTVKNYREYYHDAIEYRDQMYALFNLGMLDLDERAKAESLFSSIARRAVRFASSSKIVGEEFIELRSKLHDKYICNFSVFQSLPDHWALDQLFPVMPIHRLDEEPTRRATLVDITCDSDGEVDKFVDVKDIKRALEVHALRPGEPYYLAFLLIGAYQDTMGDMHNLFGCVHEAEVTRDSLGRHRLRHLERGDAAADTLHSLGYDQDDLAERIRVGLEERVASGSLDPDEAGTLLADYRARLDRYTYLD